MMNKSFLVLFCKKEPLARGWRGAAGQAAARKRKTALLFEKRSKNFDSLIG
jgi:hypothetical protein